MFEQDTKPGTGLGDWLIRGGIAVAFVFIGADKFTGSEWVSFFAQLGIGQWFRYFTGVVEILGGLLLLTPWTVTVGLALLACTMGCAALIDIFVVGHPEFSMFSGGIMFGLVIFYLHRRD